MTLDLHCHFNSVYTFTAWLCPYSMLPLQFDSPYNFSFSDMSHHVTSLSPSYTNLSLGCSCHCHTLTHFWSHVQSTYSLPHPSYTSPYLHNKSGPNLATSWLWPELLFRIQLWCCCSWDHSRWGDESAAGPRRAAWEKWWVVPEWDDSPLDGTKGFEMRTESREVGNGPLP